MKDFLIRLGPVWIGCVAGVLLVTAGQQWGDGYHLASILLYLIIYAVITVGEMTVNWTKESEDEA